MNRVNNIINSLKKRSELVVYELFTDAIRFREAQNYFLPLFEKIKLIPIHDKMNFDFKNIVNSFKYLESNEQIGKIVIRN